jgi:hypothetical protein
MKPACYWDLNSVPIKPVCFHDVGATSLSAANRIYDKLNRRLASAVISRVGFICNEVCLRFNTALVV